MAKAKVKRKGKSSKRREAQKLVETYLTWQAMMKNCFVQMDDVLGKLLAIAEAGETFVVLGVTYTIVDNYAGKNTAFKQAAFKRFDLKPTK